MSNSHTFAPGAEQLIVDLTPPAGATAVTVKFTATMPTAPGPAGGVRLAHVRLLHPNRHPNASADQALPRETEICELIVRNGTPTAGFSGFGGKRANHAVQHMGATPAIFPVLITIPLDGKSVSVSAGAHTAISDTDLVPGGAPMQLLLGMASLAHGDGVNTLSPPYGWTFEWGGDAVSWVGSNAQSPGTPSVTGLPIATAPTAAVREVAVEAAVQALAPHGTAAQMDLLRVAIRSIIGGA